MIGGPFGGNRDPEYLSMNPNGLADRQGRRFDQVGTNTICRYLATTYMVEHIYRAIPPRALMS